MSSGLVRGRNFFTLYKNGRCGLHSWGNMQIGDVILIKDNNAPHNKWQLPCVTEAQRGNDELVRKVNLAIGNQQLSASGKRTKPLSLALLEPCNSHERPGIPNKEPNPQAKKTSVKLMLTKQLLNEYSILELWFSIFLNNFCNYV